MENLNYHELMQLRIIAKSWIQDNKIYIDESSFLKEKSDILESAIRKMDAISQAILDSGEVS